jgi:hypothetical protein
MVSAGRIVASASISIRALADRILLFAGLAATKPHYVQKERWVRLPANPL